METIVNTELTDVSFCLLAHTGVSVIRSLMENFTYKFVSASHALFTLLG